jgi:molybdenum cofactor synthesis domain-containing protein
MNVGVLTISDRVSQGQREDRSGPSLKDRVEQQHWRVILYDVVSDDQTEIEEKLIMWSDQGEVDLILTTGGTGFSARDRAPEATLAIVERQAPGLAEAMRAASLKVTPHAMLSRAVAGIRGRTLIVNLPGSPKAAEENLNTIVVALPHAIELLRENPEAEAGHQYLPPDPHA